ncbi:MAG: carboxypeptidase regulatory-like domain-containing protein [Planctomycetes bacterium]|nr:carboxypeptidase regulatory-like domain-containing protein [Planctomycetota bacterium]
MKHGTRLRRVVIVLAAVGFCMPQTVVEAATTKTPSRVISDIQLQNNNALVGQVVTPSTTPVVGVDVSLHGKNQRLATCKTDANGCFAFPGLQAGVYHVITPNGEGVYRVWAGRAAPPAARSSALIVTQTRTVRGQHSARKIKNLLANPFVVAGIVATAVAIPVALHNSKKSPASGH